ncbi:uncharacterized protein [Paramormyrops kingsleyae]|uniref:Si:ch211-214j8.12 n=1 Tax=Paramormyrops kingsleyae TaxID=1676925 RepID=A0A3B3Q385_9TELE|nr:uncharacterized protein LOC111856568 [Paramormyrops kingsleyae]XP_023692412.1 uncharacterized protein LOC111856568 [Paramormyrops kingsleyae]
MPLFRRPEACLVKKGAKTKRKSQQGKRENDGDCSSLIRLCLWSLVENMKDVWTKDYAKMYMDQYSFRYIIGPFNILPGHLVEELLFLLSSHRLMTRPALHLLLVPQVKSLSLSACSSLVTPHICQLIGIRCQALLSLDLSGAQHLSALVLSELLGHLTRLHSLCLAGTQCDGSVLQIVGSNCRELRQLDVSGCYQLTPIGLLSLVHPPASHTRLPLRSLVASDIGFAKGDDERVAVAVFLLLTLPCLVKTALDGLGDAFDVIESQDFADLEAFCSLNGMPNLKELWDERIQIQGKLTEEKETKNEGLLDEGMERWLSESEEPDGDDESENGSEHEEADGGKVKVQEKILLHCDRQEEVKDIGRTEGQTRYAKSVLQDHLTLPLREAQGISCRNMRALGRLCPDLCALSLDCDNSELGQLAVALERWTHELLSLSLHFAGILTEILPAIQTVGATLHHLHLEGVKISDDASFLQLLCLCTKLRTLAIHTESPILNEDEEEDEEDEEQGIQALPCLSQLRFLSVKFFIDHSKKKPLMCWRSLKWVLLGLLRGSPLLEKVTLFAIPCSINSVFQMLLETHHLPPATDRIPPLCQLRYLSLAYCDVSMETATRLVTLDSCLSTLDLSGCWAVSADIIEQLQWNTSRRKHSLKIVWT